MRLKHTSLYLIIIMLCAATSFAALDFESKSLYAHGEVLIPMGDWGDFVNTGFGGGLGVHVPAAPLIGVRGEIGYIKWATEDPGEGIDTSASSIPIMVLVHYDMPANNMYLLGGLGAWINSAKAEYSDTQFGDFSYDESETDIGLSVGAGIHPAPKLSIEGRFNMVSDANSLGLIMRWDF